MRLEACFRSPAVRYASVDTEFWGRKIHGQSRKSTDESGGSGYTDRPTRFFAPELALYDAG